MSLSLSDKQVFYNVSTDLRITNPQWLIDLVRFESGFNPKAKNPLSSARGLIQFINATARGLGYASSLDLVNKNPTIAEQMEGPVKQYLSPYAPYTSEHQLYMAVFLPVARKYSSNTSFETIYKKTFPNSWQQKYALFKKGNPRINTPQDYVNFVKKKPIIRVVTKSGIALIIGGALYLLYKKYS